MQFSSPVLSIEWGSLCFLPESVRDLTIGSRLFLFLSLWWWCLFRSASRTFILTLSSSSWAASWWSSTKSTRNKSHMRTQMTMYCFAWLNCMTILINLIFRTEYVVFQHAKYCNTFTLSYSLKPSTIPVGADAAVLICITHSFPPLQPLQYN